MSLYQPLFGDTLVVVVKMLGARIAALACVPACGPEVAENDDVYPINCGAAGPVELFDAEADAFWIHAARIGDRYLVTHVAATGIVEYWSVERVIGQAMISVSSPW